MNSIALTKLAAFIKRDFLIESSYKVAFLLSVAASLFPLFAFYFIAKLIDSGNSAALSKYGGDYFPFVLIGIAFSRFFMVALVTFGAIVRQAQTSGILEAILSTQTKPRTVILFTSAYTFLFAIVQVVIIVAVGGLLLKVDYSNTNILSATVTIILSIGTFSALGILSATAIVVLKKGDPIGFAVGSASSFLGGALFPITVLPDWLQMISKCLPITYALEAMRMSVFLGQSLTELWLPLTILGAMCVVLLPASLFTFNLAIEKSRRDGSLGHY